MWIPSHVGLVGNELVDEWARKAALEGSIFDRPLSPSDFQSLACACADERKWDSADTGKKVLLGLPWRVWDKALMIRPFSCILSSRSPYVILFHESVDIKIYKTELFIFQNAG
jgi:hypothetical protein